MSQLRTVLDYHIAVRQELNKLDSYRDQDYKPEQIDWQLNKAQERFMDHIFDTEFEDTQRRLSYVKNLIQKNHRMPAVEFLSTDKNREDDAVYMTLPGDFAYLINSRFNVYHDPTCSITATDYQEDFSEFKAKVIFPEDSDGVYPFYPEIEIRIGNIVYYNQTFALNTADEISPIIHDIMYVFNRKLNSNNAATTFKVYWESYQNEYEKNALFFVLDQNATVPPLPTIVTIEIKRGGSVVKTTSSTLGTFTPGNAPKTYSASLLDASDLIPLKPQGKQPVLNQLYQWQTQNSLFKSEAIEPSFTLASGIMYAYLEKEKFLISSSIIDYIRQPRQISLALNRTCEIAHNGPNKIVDWAIERMKLIIENPNVAAMTQHNELRTN